MVTITLPGDWDDEVVLPARGGVSREGDVAGCGGCTQTWTASTNIAHCGTCHETFSTVANFDRHRVAGRCLTRDEMERRVDNHGARVLLVDERGFWRGPSRPDGWGRD